MELLILAIKVFIVFNVIMGLASLCTWFERKVSALIQDRVGANRAGAYLSVEDIFGDFFRPASYPQPAGILLVAPVRYLVLEPVFMVLRFLGLLGVINTLLCDAVKALTKEDFVPEGVSNFMHSLAPLLAVLPVFLAFAVVPLAPDFSIGGYDIRLQVAPLDAGLLFLLAMGSLAVYGVILAGWTGNNKFSLLGALRASAQMISYELALGVAIATVILMYGTLDLYEIVEAQKEQWGIFTWTGWLAGIIFFVVGMAETKRGPFDLPESESELVAGYFTEYSGMKFLLFWLGEFAEIGLFALVLAVLFFGGWHLPFVDLPEGTWVGALLGHGILMTKVAFFALLQVVIRWTLPRFRFDQLMNLGWKVLLPLSLVNFFVTAVLVLEGVYS